MIFFSKKHFYFTNVAKQDLEKKFDYLTLLYRTKTNSNTKLKRKHFLWYNLTANKPSTTTKITYLNAMLGCIGDHLIGNKMRKKLK